MFQSLLRFSIPVLGTLILQVAYGAVDLLIAGKFGNAPSISTVGTGSFFMQMATFIMLVPSSVMQSVSAFVAQNIGAGKKSRAWKGFSADCILTCVLFSSIGYFNGCGKSIPVMIQGITSAFCIRIPVSIIRSRLPKTSLTYVGMVTPITTVYGIIFFVICFWRLNKNSAK